MSPEFSFPTVTYGISNLLFNSINKDLTGRYCEIAFDQHSLPFAVMHTCIHVEHLSGHMPSFRQINDGLDNIFCIRKHSDSLAKRERKGLNARIEELDLKSPAST
jgi:hypothetical protein